MKKILTFLDKKLERTIAVFLMVVLVVLASWSVFARFVLNSSLAWSEELIRYIFIAMVYMAASAAVIDDSHSRVELVDLVLSPKALKWLNVVLKTVWGLFTGLIAYNSISLVQKTFAMRQSSPTLKIPMGYVYMVLPICFTLMTFRIFQNIWRMLRTPAEDKKK